MSGRAPGSSLRRCRKLRRVVVTNERIVNTKFSLDDCKVLLLPKIGDPRGNLTFVEGDRHIPFAIQRVYYLYDVPGGAERGGHAIHLNRSYSGLYVCPMIWRALDNFSSGSVCMVLASNRYEEDDYYREYSEYVEALSRS
jgi:hypothetical protein